MRYRPAVVLMAFLPFLAAARQEADHHAIKVEPPSGPHLELPEGREEISIPFRLVNQHIVLPVQVNGGASFQVVLDTGMPMEALGLHDSVRVDALQLAYLDNQRAMVGGAGGSGKAKPARMAAGLTIQIGDLKIGDARAIILPPIPGFAAYSDGVIGALLFRHFTVTVDNDRSVVVLRRPGTYTPPAGAAVVSLVEEKAVPYVEAGVRVGDGEAVRASLVVDLGATHAVSLNEGGTAGIVLPQRTIKTSIGRGMSGMLTGRVGRIRSLELGGFVLPEVVATFPDKEHHSPRGMDSRNGNLGNRVLSRFNVTFDYAGSRMVLQPSRRFAEPFEWDMSGMRAEPNGEGSMQVREVLPGSPAAEAGVKEDDVVLRIGGVPVDEANYFVLREQLRKAGETIEVELRRGRKPFVVALELRRLI